MSFGLARGRQLDPAPGQVLISSDELGGLPDQILTDPRAGWQDLARLFPQPERPLHLEIGSGKGAFLVEQAGDMPGINFLGIEWAREFAVYTADRIRRRVASGTHDNIRVLCHDATELLRWRTPDRSIDVIHLYFSDPWPKAKHHKNRVVQDRFLADVWRVLKDGRDDLSADVNAGQRRPGELRVVTDHPELWAWNAEHFGRWCGPEGWRLLAGMKVLDGPGEFGDVTGGPFELLPFESPAGARPGEIIGTNFERKFRPVLEGEGRGFHAGVLRKVPR